MARRKARGIGRGPTERELEVADLEGTSQVVGDYAYDTPTTDEVLQAETSLPNRPVPVEVANVVRTDEMPCSTGGIYTRNCALVPNRALLNYDPKRKLATVCPIGGDVRFGSTQGEAAAVGAGGVWPNGVPFLYSSADELWCAGVAASVPVTVIIEMWSL